MTGRKLAMYSAVAALAIAPVAAQAAPARAAAPTEEGNQLFGTTPTFAIIAALIILGLTIYLATKNNGNGPASP
jgi:hypothetical protein